MTWLIPLTIVVPLLAAALGLMLRSHPLARDTATLAGAAHYPRAHAKHLRPRLMSMAHHFLPIRHGIDPVRDPERVAALLGDEAWLIDPAVTDRRAGRRTGRRRRRRPTARSCAVVRERSSPDDRAEQWRTSHRPR